MGRCVDMGASVTSQLHGTNSIAILVVGCMWFDADGRIAWIDGHSGLDSVAEVDLHASSLWPNG
ncbi:hypothetical protein C447_12530 [Halococcus hamelinensis 100A6]|uniref:Uncharacterized protein n=1 Tax=Halococcus hamelinensis 100A6 TaxID=1132509 RepID=M0LW35_9EURY|nr:hypothetical protein C447_12530 [Halococcus hamelinensis 100A6]